MDENDVISTKKTGVQRHPFISSDAIFFLLPLTGNPHNSCLAFSIDYVDSATRHTGIIDP